MESGSLLHSAQAAGFIVAGEPLAVDLADTLITVEEPAVDLLPDEEANRRWWELQQERLPGGPPPPLESTVELRQAIRHILDARLAEVTPDDAAVARVNAAAAGAPSTRSLVYTPSGWAAVATRHATADRPYLLALAAAAESLIDVLTGPAPDRLRRCQNPSCSMLFVASDARRKFCTQNICANRTRVARHYQRHRPD
ncbi:CGNR zinc finger domain-containing protein [Mycolicibacterium aichiense]|uniref:CGNR zinc finger domain-containing protein n=1 Tax=Mycolicibacterium aichiense TaxID=1799 RepID=UPI003D67ABEA